MKYEELRLALRDIDLRDDVRISECEVVSDGKKFVKSHILVIEATRGKSDEVRYRIARPFFKRLKRYYSELVK